MISVVKAYEWTIKVIDKGYSENFVADFEDCFITDKKMTKNEAIAAAQEGYIDKNIVVVEATFYEVTEIKIDLLRQEIIK